jgi:trk system potassium uptake protein TrkA
MEHERGVFMQRQAIVIGLGQFGLSLSRALAERGVEVLAVDVREDRVRVAAEFVAEAACCDATESDTLERMSPGARDVCICAIGDDSREDSIICTALLRQLGAKRVIARANDALHERILRLVGAHQVVNPEREFGDRFANQILHAEIKGELPLGDGMLITEATTPAQFVGRSLAELRLPRRFGITVVAVRRSQQESIVLPHPDTKLAEGDVMVMIAKQDAVARMMEEG